jgi:hypothetical protein
MNRERVVKEKTFDKKDEKKWELDQPQIFQKMY